MTTFLVGLASVGVLAGGIVVETIADSVLGLPRARLNVKDRLDQFLSQEQDTDRPAGTDAEENDGRKHLPSDPVDRTVATVADWLCAVRPVVSVTVRLYVGAAADANCEAGVTVSGMDNRRAAGVQADLDNFAQDVLSSPDLKRMSLMVTVSSLDKDDVVEGKAAAFVARAVAQAVREEDARFDMAREIIVPRDCEEPDDIAPGTIMYKTAPVAGSNDDTIDLDAEEAVGSDRPSSPSSSSISSPTSTSPVRRTCNLLVTGETGSGKSTVCNVVAQCGTSPFLFPIKQNSTGSTVIRSVQKVQHGTTYRIFDTPGFEDASGADSVTACDLWNLTREIERVSCVAHVTAHSVKRPGVIDANGLNKYLRVIGEAARRRLCLIVTHEAGENPRRTVQNCVMELMKRCGVSRTNAESRVMTVDLTSARTVGTHPSVVGSGSDGEDDEGRDGGKTASENLKTTERIMLFCRSGYEETEHAINKRIAFQNLSENPNGPFAEATRNEIINDHLEAWRVRVSRLGAVYEAQVNDQEGDDHKVTVSLGGGSRLLGGKKVFYFALHFTRKQDKSEFVTQSFSDAEGMRQWFKTKSLTPMMLGQEEMEKGMFAQYETFYYKIVDKDGLHNVKWVQNTVTKKGDRATKTVMWDRFEKILKRFILSPPADEDDDGLFNSMF